MGLYGAPIRDIMVSMTITYEYNGEAHNIQEASMEFTVDMGLMFSFWRIQIIVLLLKIFIGSSGDILESKILYVSEYNL